MKKALILLSVSAAVMFVIDGCGKDENPTQPQTGILNLSFTGLDNLGSGYAYEGWVLVNGSPVSTGTFTVDGNGNMSRSSFEVMASDLNAATKFILTIEPSPDDDPAPSSVHYLAGDFSGNMAVLNVADGAALGDDFTQAMGSYILQTPSTSSIDADYSQGIWWLDPSGGPGPSLDLPELPAGWVYEGWVVGMDGPVTTGRFTMATGADSDMGGPYAGPDGVPPFPGQDFIDPPMDLVGKAAVITIEPEPDNSADPFTLKPLVDMNIEDVGLGGSQDMVNNAGTFPVGTANR
jgi:hypothetical protein